MSKSSSKKSPPSVVDIQMALEMNGSDHYRTPSDLKYGRPSVGTMAKTSKIMSPLALFQRNESEQYSFQGTDSTASEDENENIGISRPSFAASDDGEESVDSEDASRIGISPASYDRPEGDLPFSPLSLMKRIDHWNFSPVSASEHLLERGNRFRSSEFWWQESNRPMPSTPMIEHSIDLSRFDVTDRMVHPHTANGHFLVNSSPLSVPPIEGLRYSLSEGMSPELRLEVSNPRLYPTDSSDKSESSPCSRSIIPRNTSLNDSMTSLSSTSSFLKQGCSDPFKIFVLLLQPKAKIFELIQLLYSPSVTTVGDILDMIPPNATEPALGNQAYYGLCRPKDGEEILDMELMASGPGGEGCARIMRGEILLAIPERYTGGQIARIGKPLLSNPKIVKLLKKSDPLSAKRTKSRRKSIARIADKPHGIPEDHEMHDDSAAEEKTHSEVDEHNCNSDNSKSHDMTDEPFFDGEEKKESSSSSRSLRNINLASLSMEERLEILQRKSLRQLPFEDID